MTFITVAKDCRKSEEPSDCRPIGRSEIAVEFSTGRLWGNRQSAGKKSRKSDHLISLFFFRLERNIYILTVSNVNNHNKVCYYCRSPTDLKRQKLSCCCFSYKLFLEKKLFLTPSYPQKAKQKLILTGRRICALVSRGCARNERRHETRPLARPFNLGLLFLARTRPLALCS